MKNAVRIFNNRIGSVARQRTAGGLPAPRRIKVEIGEMDVPAEHQIKTPAVQKINRFARSEKPMAEPVHQSVTNAAERKMTDRNQRFRPVDALATDQLLRRLVQKPARKQRIRRPRRIEHQKTQRPGIKHGRIAVKRLPPVRKLLHKIAECIPARTVAHIGVMVARREKQRDSRFRQGLQIGERLPDKGAVPGRTDCNRRGK